MDVGLSREPDPANYVFARVGYELPLVDRLYLMGLVGGYVRLMGNDGGSAFTADALLDYHWLGGFSFGLGAGYWSGNDGQIDLIANLGVRVVRRPGGPEQLALPRGAAARRRPGRRRRVRRYGLGPEIPLLAVPARGTAPRRSTAGSSSTGWMSRLFFPAAADAAALDETGSATAENARHTRGGDGGAMAERTISNILVANRGVPAVRIMHTCRDRKIRSTAVYSTPDRLAHHVSMADAAVHIGEAPPVESYLNMDRIIDAALRSKADAVHAGWGFLAENAAFARRVIDAGLIWIGPPPEVIGRIGDKIEAKQIARAAQVPVIPGIDHVTEAEQVRRWMREENVAFPVMLKAAGGGGGRGMVKVEHDAHLHMAIGQARSEAKKFFGSETVLAEKYVERGRHIEVQIIADEHGNVVHLYERECTIQRRHQKIVEEAPSPTLDARAARGDLRHRGAPDARDRLRLGRHRGVPLRLGDPRASTSSRSTPGSRSSTASPS